MSDQSKSRGRSKKAPKRKKVDNKNHNGKENSYKFNLLINNIEDQFRSEKSKLKSSLLGKIKRMTADHQLMLNQQIPPNLGDMVMSEILELAMKQEQEQENLKNEEELDDFSTSRTLSRMRCNSDSAIKVKNSRNSLKASAMKRAESVKSLTGKRKSKQELEAEKEIFYTPLGGKKKITAVTPKVDLSKPLARSSMRTPHPGELLLSLSGSPIYLPSMLGKKMAGTSSATYTLQKAHKMLTDTRRK